MGRGQINLFVAPSTHLSINYSCNLYKCRSCILLFKNLTFFITQKQEEEGVLSAMVIMDPVEMLQLLALQDIISVGLGMMSLTGHGGSMLHLGGNHFPLNVSLTDLMVEGNMMILIIMMNVHMA